MRKVILLMHCSLDGFVAGPKGEMEWINVDEELFDDVGSITEEADTALFGRVTYELMESYWPTAAEQPNASRHAIKHSAWVNNALKIVFSKTLVNPSWNNTRVIHQNIEQEIQALKHEPGKNLLMIGSARTAHYFMDHALIDEYYINVNPILLGSGIPFFKDIKVRTKLDLLNVNRYDSGVLGLHYRTK